MTELSLGIMSLLMTMFGGVFLGLLFYGGLWWTVQKGMQSSHTGIWFLVSAVVRMSLVILGFYIITDAQLLRLLACLAGFIIARLYTTWLSQKQSICQEVDHAPES